MAAKSNPMMRDSTIVTITEYFAATGRPNPSSFETLTLRKWKGKLKSFIWSCIKSPNSNMKKKEKSHGWRIYLIAALIPINNIPSHPFIFMLREEKQNTHQTPSSKAILDNNLIEKKHYQYVPRLGLFYLDNTFQFKDHLWIVEEMKFGFSVEFIFWILCLFCLCCFSVLYSLMNTIKWKSLWALTTYVHLRTKVVGIYNNDFVLFKIRMKIV